MVYLPGIEKSGGIFWGRLWLKSHVAIDEEEEEEEDNDDDDDDNDDDDSGE
jgi:hypothetical protein